MLPQGIKKDIDDIKSPAGRILITILLIAISILSTAYYKVTEARLAECEASCAKANRTIDSLKNDIVIRVEGDNRILKIRIEWQDSIKNALQKIVDSRK